MLVADHCAPLSEKEQERELLEAMVPQYFDFFSLTNPQYFDIIHVE